MVKTRPDRDSRWTLRAFPLRMNTDGDSSDTVAVDFSERTNLTVGGGTGFGASAEYRPSSRWGIEAAVLYAEADAVLVYDSLTEWLMASADEEFLALTIGPNLHLTPDKRADVYVGAFVGLAQLSDATFNLGGTVGSQSRNFDDEVLLGLQLGVDVPFGAKGWAFHASGRLMDVSASGPGTDLDLNPFIGAIGLAYNF